MIVLYGCWLAGHVVLIPVLRGTCRLSGLSPFMGDDDTETMQNVLKVQEENVEFDDDSFDVVSDMGKAFIQELLVFDPRYIQ